MSRDESVPPASGPDGAGRGGAGPDDPRLSARAVGETGAADGSPLSSGESPLTPEEQAEVDSLRATADLLRAGFAATPMPTLDPAHRAAILQGLSDTPQGLSGTPRGLSHEPAEPGRGTVPGSVVRLAEYSGLGALAATLLLVVGFGIAGATGGGVSVKRYSALEHYPTSDYGDGLYVVDADLDSSPEIGGHLRVRRGIPELSPGMGGAGGAGGDEGGIQSTTELSWEGKTFYQRGVGGGSGAPGGMGFGGGGGGGSRQYAGGARGQPNPSRNPRKVVVGYGGSRDLRAAQKLNTPLGLRGRLDASHNGSIGYISGGTLYLDDVSNGLDDRASIGLDNAGVGVPANASGKPSAGAFFNLNSDGDFRGRAEHVLTLKGNDREEYLAQNFRRIEVGGGASKQTIYVGKGDKLPFNVGTGGFEDWVQNKVVVGAVVRQADEEVHLFDVKDITAGMGELPADDIGSTESTAPIVENPWIRPYGEAALSTFSIDVDTAGYSIVRRCLVEQNRLPPPGALRVEELLNYFPYEYAGPATADPFAVHVDAAACPWAPGHRLVRIALKGREVEEAARPAANLVFLVDVSGSMNQANKLPLVQKSMAMLADGLTARDRIAMVVYAGSSGLVLPSTPAGDPQPIRDAIGRLQAGGSTNGGAGIELAYRVAHENFIPGGINRVVLATDGDFNVGVSDPSALVKMVEEKAKGGVFLTALGYGMDNLKDSTLEQLADKGNGNYGYIDGLPEARKVLVEQGMGTLHCIAKDVKIQVEFNPAKVAGYRLLGYENRVLAAQDFADDRKDAGEIGAGHTVTALYEVVPAGVEVPGAAVDELRFQRPGTYAGAAETLLVKLRWKEPEGQVSTPREFPFVDGGLSFESGSDDLRFAAAVAAFGMVLRGSKEAGSANLDLVREIAAGALGSDPGGWRAEFLTLVEKARALRK